MQDLALVDMLQCQENVGNHFLGFGFCERRVHSFHDLIDRTTLATLHDDLQ
jgi:hypothetical protein